MSEKELIRVYRDGIGYELHGKSISDAFKYLVSRQENIMELRCGATEIKLEYLDREWEDGMELCITGHRLENDKEFAARLEKEAADQARRDEWDRKQFERLKGKFGG